MSKRWILGVVAAGFLALASRGVCHGTVRRPVVKFIDFYTAADHAERPVTLFERVTYGLAFAAQTDPVSDPSTTPTGD